MEFDKTKRVNKNRTISYNVSNGYVPMQTIKEDIFEDGEFKKNYRLNRWDDYGFVGWSNDKKDINKLSFEFDKDHPLYIPLLHLINFDEEILIDDDDTYEINKKYLLIHKEEDKIIMDFINKLSTELEYEKFRVFIKNVGIDCRSKIDVDTKDRLYCFFKESYEELTNTYHQETIEEYTIKNNPEIETKELKKYKLEKELRYGINNRI